MEKYLSEDNKEVVKLILEISVASWGVNEFTILHSSDVPAKNTLLKPTYIFPVCVFTFFSDKDV